MSLETLPLEHLPETHKAHLAFFRNVQNASFLHEQLLARNSAFEYAFIDASVVSSSLVHMSLPPIDQAGPAPSATNISFFFTKIHPPARAKIRLSSGGCTQLHTLTVTRD
jgi:hypothetical protein